MVGSIDLVRFVHRAMVEPKDDIAVVAVLVVEVGAGDCNRLI